MRFNFPKPLSVRDEDVLLSVVRSRQADGCRIRIEHDAEAVQVIASMPSAGYRRFLKDFVSGTTD